MGQFGGSTGASKPFGFGINGAGQDVRPLPLIIWNASAVVRFVYASDIAFFFRGLGVVVILTSLAAIGITSAT